MAKLIQCLRFKNKIKFKKKETIEKKRFIVGSLLEGEDFFRRQEMFYFLSLFLKNLLILHWSIADYRASLMARTKNPPAMWETWVLSLGWEDPLEEGMATHSSILAWRISWTEEPEGYSPWGHKESDVAERLSTAQHIAD